MTQVIRNNYEEFDDDGNNIKYPPSHKLKEQIDELTNILWLVRTALDKSTVVDRKYWVKQIDKVLIK